MKFHPSKCKVLSVTGKVIQPLLSVLPFTQFVYSLGEDLLNYVDCEKDLVVIVNSCFNWSEQCGKVYSKANQKLGLSRRTCHFVLDKNRRRVHYFTLARSQFEHCSIIWRPLTKANIDRIENLQKRALKWILSEENISYTPFTTYIQKCRQLNIMPISLRFDFLDLIFFYKVVHGMIPVELPPYLTPYLENNRLRSSHLDQLCFVSTITPRTTSNELAKSFFYRTHTKWNNIPYGIRQIKNLVEFKAKLTKLMWDSIMTEVNDDIEEHLWDENSVASQN